MGLVRVGQCSICYELGYSKSSIGDSAVSASLEKPDLLLERGRHYHAPIL